MFFTNWVIFWNIIRICFFQACKISEAVVTIFFSNFFPVIFCWWKISFPIVKSLIFVIFCRSFSVSSSFNATVTAYFLLTGFIIAFLFFYPLRRIFIWFTTIDIYYKTTEHNPRQNHYLPLIVNYFDIYFYVNQKVFYNFICFFNNHDFYVITFWMHYTLLIINIFRRNKINCYC